MDNPLGKFADQVAEGNVFSVSTLVAGLAIPISTTTAPTLALWNRLDSGVRVVPLRYVIAGVSGTVASTAVGFQYATGAGREVGATEVYSVFSNTTPVPARLGSGAVSNIYASAAGTNTLVAAIVAWISPAFHLGKEVINTDIVPSGSLIYDFEGLVQLEPGTTIFPAAAAASGALFQQTLYWAEVPLS